MLKFFASHKTQFYQIYSFYFKKREKSEPFSEYKKNSPYVSKENTMSLMKMIN